MAGNANCIARHYNKLDYLALRSHFGFCERALTEDSYVRLVLPQKCGEVPIRKRFYKTKPSLLELQISAGYLKREAIAEVAERLKTSSISAKLGYTKERKKISRITSVHSTENSTYKDEMANVIAMLCDALECDVEGLSITYLGVLDSHYSVSRSDPVKMALGYRLGCFLGGFVRSISGTKR